MDQASLQMIMAMQVGGQRAFFEAFRALLFLSSNQPMKFQMWWRSQAPIAAVEYAIVSGALKPAGNLLTGRPRSQQYISTLFNVEVEDWAEDYDDESPVEVERRHPGDKIEDDAEIEYDINEMFSPLTTKAGCTLQAIHFVSDTNDQSTSSTSLHAAYPMQLLMRIDRGRKLLVYDCLEYKPALFCSSPEFKPAKGRALRRIMRSLDMHSGVTQSSDESEDGDSDEEGGDESMQEEKKHCAFTAEQFHRFVNSRVLRCRVNLESVQGMQLLLGSGEEKRSHGLSHAHDNDDGHHGSLGEEEAMRVEQLLRGGDVEGVGVLILELSSPPVASAGDGGEESSDDDEEQSDAVRTQAGAAMQAQPQGPFATRRIHSHRRIENEWKITGDWTPGQCASKVCMCVCVCV
jgi:hypothetical protein